MAKTILITGASSGIGRSTALFFAQRGWNVVATMRNTEKADASLKQPNIGVSALDVTDDASIETAVAEAQSRFGAIDVLLNNAGYGLFGALEAMSAEQIDQQLRTNLYGLMRVTQRLIPLMRAQRQGVIVNMSSIGGRMSFPYAAAYNATKFAVEGFSESLRYELAGYNIRVKVIEPGAIATDFSTRSMVSATNDVYRSSFDKMMAMMEKFSKSLPGPEHVAKTIFRAATDGSKRLHYVVKPGPFLLLRCILPDSGLRWVLQKMI